jgi:hypothetical protein
MPRVGWAMGRRPVVPVPPGVVVAADAQPHVHRRVQMAVRLHVHAGSLGARYAGGCAHRGLASREGSPTDQRTMITAGWSIAR